MRVPLFIVKVLNYEYWPCWLFYLPVAPYWIYLSLKLRTFSFFSAANPGITLGGFVGESKTEILNKIDEKYLPKFISAKDQTNQSLLLKELHERNMEFPLIAKPDAGLRGNKVQKITCEEELLNYHQHVNCRYIIQEFVDYDIELGVFYSRLPCSQKGKVSSVVFKEFLSVTGDGCSSILKLMEQNQRARFQIKRFKREMGVAIDAIPAKGEKITIEPIGNHCRGTRFINYNTVINENLNAVFDKIALPIDGFYYGRFDLKVKNMEDLYRGENIKIMELNGAVSEPGHIYDTEFSLFRAYRDLLAHWRCLAEIAEQNIILKFRPAPFSEIIRAYCKSLSKNA